MIEIDTETAKKYLTKRFGILDIAIYEDPQMYKYFYAVVLYGDGIEDPSKLPDQINAFMKAYFNFSFFGFGVTDCPERFQQLYEKRCRFFLNQFHFGDQYHLEKYLSGF